MFKKTEKDWREDTIVECGCCVNCVEGSEKSRAGCLEDQNPRYCEMYLSPDDAKGLQRRFISGSKRVESLS